MALLSSYNTDDDIFTKRERHENNSVLLQAATLTTVRHAIARLRENNVLRSEWAGRKSAMRRDRLAIVKEGCQKRLIKRVSHRVFLQQIFSSEEKGGGASSYWTLALNNLKIFRFKMLTAAILLRSLCQTV